MAASIPKEALRKSKPGKPAFSYLALTMTYNPNHPNIFCHINATVMANKHQAN